ncbi:MAG: hypothetical protein JNL48_12185 [Acidobacteria bacterium]|nr:hypothetical protein [Acidobacteriota bacterium]
MHHATSHTRLVQQTVRHPWPIFLGALVLSVVGFWPGFFAQLPATPLPHHIHGWSATAWMLLPLLQYGLIRRGRRDLHRRLGYAAVVLAAIVATSGVYVVRMMAFSNIASFSLASVKFVWLDLTGISLFCVYVSTAVTAARRHDVRLHVTALVASAFIPLEAALERVFVNLFPWFVPNFDAALYASLISLELACTVIVISEWRSGRVRWPIPVLLAYYVCMHVTLTPLATSTGFQRFSNWLGMVGRAGS